ncbi:tyrosine-type recombinase/integrase [Rossellomorea sp. LjRoot5]|uniref:tyrosine-type recombinase/integrase n=1 Tax=Rossellomorea sp. LjRoot5 TaxID=3342331 RepID=UPI003ECF095A
MDTVIESKGYFGKNFKRIRGENEYHINVAAIAKEYNGFKYMMLFGSSGKVYYEAYKYLNEELGNEGYSKREQAFRALKLLFSYIELFHTDIKHLDSDDKNRIIHFLIGGKGLGKFVTYEFSTIRKNDTVNKYLGVYRSFYRYLKIENNIFEESNGTKRVITSAFNSKSTSIEKPTYNINLRETKRRIVPKYISYPEYENIIKLIENKYTLREKIIIKLMYEYGLRIGEVLGLTLEDIQGEDITKRKDIYRIILRNRFTDRPWQFCKGCMKITSRESYNNEGYYEEGDGFQVILITKTTFELIQEYIDEATSPFSMSDKTFENYSNKNVADKVGDSDIDFNAYVFLSKNYTCITGGAWNKILKTILKDVGIKLDKDKKKDSLNHRFRHGFAMYKVLHEGYDELKLAYVLRHSNTHTVRKYFNPTEDDLANFAIKQDELTKKGLNL